MRYLICLFVLSGCASQPSESEQRAQAKAYWQGVRAQCKAYGHAEKTPEFKNCVMQVDLANRQQSEAQRQMLQQQLIYQQGVFRPQ